MGGTFSTRWAYESTRQTTGGLLRLDVRALNRAGCLRPGAVHAWGWTRGGGEPAGDIVLRMNRHGDCLTLEYRTKRYGETQWTPRNQRVWLETTPCHFGGHRVWFTCPGCGDRRAVLFSAGGVFRCRACHDLAYASTREDAIDRGGRRIRTLQRKLHAPAGCDSWHIPPKPAGMHGSRYARLARRLHAAILQREALLGARLGALEARMAAVLDARRDVSQQHPET